jgi:hypothetical protein
MLYWQAMGNKGSLLGMASLTGIGSTERNKVNNALQRGNYLREK